MWREKIDAGTANQFMEECERRRRMTAWTHHFSGSTQTVISCMTDIVRLFK